MALEYNDKISGALMAVEFPHKMDSLASDFTHALDDSQTSHRKRRGLKRRNNKLLNNIGAGSGRFASEDSSSSVGEVGLSQDNKSSIHLTDSDELSPTSEDKSKLHLLTHHRASSNLVESDSFNENFSPAHLNNRRKQKCKRLVADIASPTTSKESKLIDSSGIILKCKTFRSSMPESRYEEASLGKRKRGRDKHLDWDIHGHIRHAKSGSQCSRVRVHSHKSEASEGRMDYESNISSSESEAGVFTCDEGREADDEQSDWFAEPGPVYGVPDLVNNRRQLGSFSKHSWWNYDSFGLSASAKALFKQKYESMSIENQHACRLRFQKLRERLLRREIRAGRRRVRDRRPGFSIVSPVNEAVSRFLQDPGQLELQLKPMTDKDRDQLHHLAHLYSLSMRLDDKCNGPILSKTKNTIITKKCDPEHLLLHSFGQLPFSLKKRKEAPPSPPHNMTEGSNDSTESVITNPLTSNSSRPPVPNASWDDVVDVNADSLSERLADSEPDPLPSPTSLALHDCTL